MTLHFPRRVLAHSELPALRGLTRQRLFTTAAVRFGANSNGKQLDEASKSDPGSNNVKPKVIPENLKLGAGAAGNEVIKARKPLSRVSLVPPKRGSFSLNNGLGPRAVWLGAVFLIIGGGGLMLLLKREKRRLEVRRLEQEHQGIGKPAIGGPFEMVDQDGKPFTDKDLLGKFSVLYFGFTKCPDICPEELEILADVLRTTNKTEKRIQPIFVTCDPHRDTPEVLKEYLKDFHSDIIGLTGTYDQVKNICKAYRVYFSTPPDVKPGDSYLVDHSIFFYIMDPEGRFIDVMGRNYNSEEATKKILEHLDSWRPSDSDDRSWFQKILGSS